MLIIENEGQEIKSTNYWDSEHARAGYVHLSCNAGAFRLLVPDSRTEFLAEIMTAKEVLISRGEWPEQGKHDALELLFEDYSDYPFALHIVPEQIDRMPADSDRHKTFVFTIWTRAGKQRSMSAKYRKVKRLPWLKPWRDSN